MAAGGAHTAIEDVRLRPGMYAGTDGDGVLFMALDVIANACDQHFAGRCSMIEVEVAPDGTITVTDDGPGMLVHGGSGVPPLRALLTQHSNRPTVDGHRPHVHLGRGGLGLFVVNALSERFELTTVRDGVAAKTIYARGEEIEPLATAPTTRATGTRIQFRPDPTIFRYPRIPRAPLTERLEDLSFVLPQLTLRWHIAGDDLAAGGLAARVALHANCPLDDVATHRASFDTPSGPVDVEVALTWLSMQWHASSAPIFHSFVNLERSVSHGTHVDGLTAFFGRGRRQRLVAGVVAAVAVVLSDVQWQSPARAPRLPPRARPGRQRHPHRTHRLGQRPPRHRHRAARSQAPLIVRHRPCCTAHAVAAALTATRSPRPITRIACRSSPRALDTPTPPTSSISPFTLPE